MTSLASRSMLRYSLKVTFSRARTGVPSGRNIVYFCVARESTHVNASEPQVNSSTGGACVLGSMDIRSVTCETSVRTSDCAVLMVALPTKTAACFQKVVLVGAAAEYADHLEAGLARRDRIPRGIADDDGPTWIDLTKLAQGGLEDVGMGL